MKRILLSLLALGAMTSCANQEMAENPQPQDLVPIDLHSGVEAVTRAEIAEIDGPITTEAFEFGIAGWEAATADYSQATTWAATASTNAGQKIDWAVGKQPYYNADNTIKTHMLAWYPHGTLADKAVTFTESTGKTDVMVASSVGSKDTKATSLTFEHKTTQFVFMVKAGTGLAATTKIESITIKDAGLATGFTFSAAGAVVTYATKNFAIPNIAADQVIGTAEAQAGDMAMLAPVNAKTFLIDVVTSDGTFSDVTVTSKDDTFLAGKAYTITLTFNQKVDVSSSVSAWGTGGEGDGTVE